MDARRLVCFGSELKALRAHPAWNASIDRDAVAMYMRFNYVPAPYSIYRGIRKLAPGTILTVSAQDVGMLPEPRSYWSAATASQPQSSLHLVERTTMQRPSSSVCSRRPYDNR